MGPLNYIKDKLMNKIEDYREERERDRERRRSYTSSSPRSWSPETHYEGRKSYDGRRRRQDDSCSSEVHIVNLADYETLAKKASKDKATGRGRNSRSEGNLADPRQSGEVIITPGEGGRGRNASPRTLESVLAGKRSKSRKKARSSNDRVNQQDIPRVWAIPPKWTEEARKSFPLRDKNQPGQQLAPVLVSAVIPQVQEYNRFQREAAEKRARNPHVGDYNRFQREAVQKKPRKPPVDWDRMIRERKQEESLAAETQRQQAAERTAAGAQRWKEIEKSKKKEEKEKEVIREREKAEKWRKADEAEKRANADRLLADEIGRKEAAIRWNEAARLKAFGPSGGRTSGSEPQRPPPAWPNYANRQTRDSAPQARPLERGETFPITKNPAARNGLEPGVPRRHDSRPNKAMQPRPKPPAPAPLTAANLKANQGSFVELVPVSELNRALGDSMRTFIEGFGLPSELESKVSQLSDIHEPSEEEENPNKRGR